MNPNENSLNQTETLNELEEAVEMPVVKEPETEDYLESSIKKLNPKQQRFVHLYLTGTYKISELADLLHVSVYGVRKWIRTPMIKRIIEEYQNEEDEIVRQGLKALKMKAVYKMGQLIESPMDAIAYQAARDVLDRGGHKAPTKMESNVTISFEQQLMEAVRQSGKQDDFVDADFEEIDRE